MARYGTGTLVTAKLTFHPLGNADCTRIDLADGRKMLIDFADMRNPQDPADKRIDLPTELKNDLRAAKRSDYDVVGYTHLDDDHTCGSSEFFWMDHATKYQGEGRTKIKELWVPAGAILEDGLDDCARVIRQEARHRLREGYGIRVFSRPKNLRGWLEANGLTLESRAHLITDAGQFVPGFSMFGPERVQFFIHAPFGWRQNEEEVIDRNQNSSCFRRPSLKAVARRALVHVRHQPRLHRSDRENLQAARHQDRLLWDIFKFPHHCSYLSIGPDKGENETKPTDEVKWLCETQGQDRSTMMSTSWSIPSNGSAEDKDVQPPHRQAAAYYKRVANLKDGQFKVTMDLPSASNPKPTTIEVTDRGARLLTISATVGAASSLDPRPRGVT